MSSILFYILNSILILLYTYRIISNNSNGLVIVGFVLSVTAMIIYIVTDGGSFIPSILLILNGMLSMMAIKAINN